MARKITSIFIALTLICASAFARAESFWIRGYRYYPLYKICQDRGIHYDWDQEGRVATLSKNGATVKMRVGSDMALINGDRMKDIGPPVFFHKGGVVIPGAFALKGIEEIFKEEARSGRSTGKDVSGGPGYSIGTIVVDPGHGGKDPGATGKYKKLYEKNVNLDISRRLKTLLAYNGFKVYLTRDSDVFIELKDRAAFARDKGADLFISVHSNASRSRWLNGFEIYYLSEARLNDSERALKAARDSRQSVGGGSFFKKDTTTEAIAYDLRFSENRVVSKELADRILRSIKRRGIYARGNAIKDARFHVLKSFKVNMPSLLVECGYLSNKREESLLGSSSYRQKVAEGIVDGIVSYAKEYRKSGGFSR